MMLRLAFAFLCLTFSFDAGAATATVLTASRNPVPAGEAFVLTLECDGDAGSSAPDFSSLEKDFKVFGAAQSARTTIVDGQVSQRRQWSITLAAKREGTFAAGPFTLGGTRSNALEIEAGKGTETAASAAASGFSVSSSVDTPSPYAQQQVNLTVAVEDKGGFGLRLGAPELDAGDGGWIIRALGQPEVSAPEGGGGRGRGRRIVFRYALFAQKSGEIRLPVFKIDGSYIDRSASGAGSGDYAGRSGHDILQEMFGGQMRLLDFDDLSVFNGGRKVPVHLETEAKAIRVKPPVSKGWWVPASSLGLSEEWRGKEPLIPGEAVHRIITISGIGVLASQLPDIALAPVEGVRQYPERPVESSRLEGDRAAGEKVFDIAYLFDKPGEFVIPEVAVEWFDVLEGKAKRAVLAERRVMVKGNAVASEPLLTSPWKGEEHIDGIASSPAAPRNDNFLYLIPAFLLGGALGWLLFARPRRRRPDHKKAIIAAAKAGDLQALSRALLDMSGARNLAGAAAFFGDAALAAQIESLSRALYAKDGGNGKFDGKAFLSAFRNASKKRRKNRKESSAPLPPLY